LYDGVSEHAVNVNYNVITVFLVEEVKKFKTQINNLQTANIEMNNRILELESRLP
jgi:ABC-type uncharacterized transport system auxiliary subunit